MTKTYSIATGNYETTKAASEILEKGGNAYDAIIAALFMSFVSEPLLSSPGGGGYLLAHPNDGNAHIFDFFAQTPHHKDQQKKDFFPIQGNFGATVQEFHIGMASAAVPGVPAGIFAIHNHYGTMPLIDIAKSAIDKANTGMKVDKLHAEVIEILSPILEASCHAKAVFSNAQKQLLKQGEIKANKSLAKFIHSLATNPMDWFYFDTPAVTIANDMHHNNGLLRKEDFENYEVIIREPLVAEINDWKILTNAKPTTGGYLITEQLKHAFKNKDKVLSHKLVESMVYAEKLKNTQSFQSSKGTTHMSIIDGEGNVASLTTSNGEGCGYMVPHFGFMLNNFLGEEDINTQGFFEFEENSRMASMMSPTILEHCNNHHFDNKIALGTGGSNRIKTAMFQVVWQIIAENKTLNQAINQPRFHYENGILDIEKGVDAETIKYLQSHYKTNLWQQRSLYFGGINAVQQGSTNIAIGDARRNGVGLVKY
jgi:gamma-glutamyltranspeptidase/glutathione hydrolase